MAANRSYVEGMSTYTPSAPSADAANDPSSTGKTNAPEVSVSELAGALKRTIENAYGRVRVRGELGRVTVAKSGHVYADLKDDRAVISTVMWKGNAARLNFRPEEGLEVVVEGKLSTYPGRSQYQLIAESMSPAGVGALMALLEERKKKLHAEGLFAQERKQKIPYLPRVIGVVTSPTGAVIRDILHRISDRFPMHVLVWPVLVQGDQAASQVAAAITGFNQIDGAGGIPRPDTVIVARGGGSLEDLWGFNEEVVVRAAAASRIPLISAVGHETDWTLIDLASDMRAPTPTGAAEMAAPVRGELLANIETLGARLSRGVANSMERRRTALTSAVRGLPRLEDMMGMKAQRLDAAGAALRAALKGAADKASIRFQRVAGRLQPQTLSRDVSLRAGRLDDLMPRARQGAMRTLADRRRALAAVAAQLEALSPKGVLARGYAMVRDGDGNIVRQGGDLAAGQAVALQFADGERAAVIDGDGVGRSTGAQPGKPVAKSAHANRDKPSAKRPDGGQGSLF